MYYVIEIEYGKVINLFVFNDFISAEDCAKDLCETEEIEYSGDLSYDPEYPEFSIQLFGKL